ncbi:MAG: ATP-binding protein [Nostocaceae cyanobacterium]|nr:ATP-binding protein [Nostocaceae cyanobacterium]
MEDTRKVMGIAFLGGLHCKYWLYLELLPVLALASCLKIEEITAAREVSAATVNISGRQRMLSQRIALLCLQLVCTQDPQQQQSLRSSLLEAIHLMEVSHNALIHGDANLNLPGQMSAKVQEMYFQPPLNLNRQVRNYISQVKALLHTPETELNHHNPHLSYILQAASQDLLTALDAVVSQYQQDSDIEQLALDILQIQLYQKSCQAEKAAHDKALELEKALQELKNTQAQLVHSEKMSALGQLVAGVAHEINNPVNFIYGNLNHATEYIEDLLSLVHLYQQEYPQPSLGLRQKIQAIELDFLTEDLPKLISSLKIGTDRIYQLVRTLRTFSRNDQGEMSVVDIHEGIDTTLLILHHRLKPNGKHQGISIVKDYGNIPLVECYPGQLNQVFMNIISNAIDALEEKRQNTKQNTQQYFSPCIKIRTQMVDGNYFAVQIIDNGQGMTETVQKHLFDPFFTTKEVGQGTGLGLSISYHIVVEKHGGIIKSTSTLGEGCEFWIELPLCQPTHLKSHLPA